MGNFNSPEDVDLSSQAFKEKMDKNADDFRSSLSTRGEYLEKRVSMNNKEAIYNSLLLILGATVATLGAHNNWSELTTGVYGGVALLGSYGLGRALTNRSFLKEHIATNQQLHQSVDNLFPPVATE
jgi:hypothetical protein